CDDATLVVIGEVLLELVLGLAKRVDLPIDIPVFAIPHPDHAAAARTSLGVAIVEVGKRTDACELGVLVVSRKLVRWEQFVDRREVVVAAPAVGAQIARREADVEMSKGLEGEV